MYRIIVKRKDSEGSHSVLKNFTTQARSSGIVKQVRSKRFEKRNISQNIKRQQRIRSLAKREEYEKKVNLGIIGGR